MKTPLNKMSDIIYDVNDQPPWYIIFIYVIQQTVSLIPSIAIQAAIIHSLVCGGDDYDFGSELMSTGIFMMGLATILQITFGIRLPIIQGSSWIFLTPIMAMMSTEKYKCPDIATYNVTSIGEPPWSSRIRVLSGSLMIGSVIQVVLGLIGVFGLITPFIGPLTIAPALSLLGLSIVGSSINLAQQQWGIALLTSGLILLFGAVLRNTLVPVPVFRVGKGFQTEKHYLFRYLPNFTAVTIAWFLCYVLTVTGALPDDPDTSGYRARTDVKISSLTNAKWFFFPVPGQWGPPLFDAGLVVSMIVASLMGMVESIGDYYTLARACEKPMPPRHAINRGLALEGFINIICGAVNMGQGTASFTAPLSFIKITGIASRLAWQSIGLSLMVVAMVGKLGAFMAMIPDPVLGGLNITLVGLVIFMGLSNLQFVDMNSSRNLLILSISLMLGLMVSSWISSTPGAVDTGLSKMDEIISAVLSSAMFIGATTGFMLDNIIPGTTKERGLDAYREDFGFKTDEAEESTQDLDVYDLPFLTRNRLSPIPFCSLIPFLPSHNEKKKRNHTEMSTSDMIEINDDNSNPEQMCLNTVENGDTVSNF